MLTLTEVLTPHGITVADEILATVEVPVINDRPQRQGDVFINPCDPPTSKGLPVPPEGIAVVRGEATGNTHLLTAIGPVFWHPAPQRSDLPLGTVVVPEGSTAYLIHTDEHGANGIGVGCFALSGKREMREVIARVAD